MNQETTGKRRFMLAMIILCGFTGCDQATKQLATTALQNAPAQSWLDGSVRLEYALNPGGFLSLGADWPPALRKWIFIGLNSILLAGVSVFLIRRWRMPLSIFVCVTLLLAGGIGNQIDRVANDGLVVDFINLGVGPIRTGVFNIADIGVTLGAVGVMLLAGRPSSVSVDDRPA